jgi:hypothetical protein
MAERRFPWERDEEDQEPGARAEFSQEDEPVRPFSEADPERREEPGEDCGRKGPPPLLREDRE